MRDCEICRGKEGRKEYRMRKITNRKSMTMKTKVVMKWEGGGGGGGLE